MELTYAVVGVGALGGYYGGRLAQSGKNVHFLLHNDYEYVKQNGLKIDSIKGDFVLNNIHAYAEASQMPVCDVVLVCLKTTNNALLKNILPHITHQNSTVILIQNGLGIEAELADEFPHLCIAGGLAFICSSKIGKGHIGHFDFGSITLGCYQGKGTERIQQVCLDLNQAQVPAYFADDLNLARWKKLVWNIPYNGMTVVLNTSTDQLMAQPNTRSLIHDLMIETITAARLCNAPISDDFVDKMLDSTDHMTPYAPSMRLDFDNHRPMEICAIYSNPIAAAMEKGYAMPKTRMLEQQLLFIQEKYLQK